MTCTPASAAASAVEITQQSVVTPASTISAGCPSSRSVSASHLPKVVRSTVVAGIDLNSSVSS
jgi:hypothetical protein